MRHLRKAITDAFGVPGTPGIEPLYAAMGRRIMRACKRAKITQEGLGAILGVTRASVSNMEAGRQRVLCHTLLILSRALSVSTKELLTGLK